MDYRSGGHRPVTIVVMSSRRWVAVVAVAVAATVGLGLVGCGGSPPPRRPTPGPPVTPFGRLTPSTPVTPRPTTPAAAVARRCPTAQPSPIPVTSGWADIYQVCVDPYTGFTLINNLSHGVLHLGVTKGRPTVINCSDQPGAGTEPLVATLAGRLAPPGKRPDGGYLLRAGQCAWVLAGVQPWSLSVTMDYAASSSVFLASAFATWTLEKLRHNTNTATRLLDGLTSCGTGANDLYHRLGFGTAPGTTTSLSTLLDDAFDLKGCKEVVTGVRDLLKEPEPLAKPGSELLTAAREIGSGGWEDLLRFAFEDPRLVELFAR
jgi:hypothetical protein